VAVGVEQVLDIVLVLRLHADDAFAAAVLRAVGVGRNALDVTGVRNGDHTAVARNQVGDVEVRIVDGDFRAARIVVFGLDFDQLLADHTEPHLAAGHQFAQVVDPDLKFIVFRLDDFDGQPGQLMQPHVEDRVRLDLGEGEAGDEIGLRVLAVARIADDLDHFVDIRQRLQQPFQNVGTGFGFVEVENRAAEHHFEPMVDVRLEHLREVHRARTVVVDHQHGAADHGFELGLAVKLVQDHAAHRAALDADLDAETDALAGDVGDRRNAVDPLVLDQLGDLLNQRTLVDRIGNFGDDDLLDTVFFNDIGLGADFDAAAPGLIELAQRIAAADDCAGREVGSGQMFHQFIDGGLGIVEQADRRVNHFAQVVGRNAGGHADADAGGAVDEKLRETGRKDFRLLLRLVEVRKHVDGVFFDIEEHLFGEALHAALGVTAGGGGVAVDVAEVALPLDQGGAHREILGEADQCVVDRRVAVRMVFTHDFADDARAFDGGV